MKAIIRDPRYVVLMIAIAFFLVFPSFSDPYNLHLVIISFTWAVVAMCWNFPLGYAGIFAFGNLLFFAIGGYSSAWLALNMAVSPWIGILIGGCLAALISLVVGASTLRLGGMYVALFTFASEELTRYIVLLPEFIPWFGGPIGLLGVPRFSIGDFWWPYVHYYLGFAILLITASILHKILSSRIGLALTSMRDSETYAISLGVNIYRYKLFTFVVSAFFTGVAGSFYSHYFGVASKDLLSFLLLASIIIMILVGGFGSFFGPIVGAFIVTFVSEYLRAVGPHLRLILFGLLIPIILIFAPSGIMKVFHFILKLRRSRAR